MGLGNRLTAVVLAREEERQLLARHGVNALEVAQVRRLTLSALEAYAEDLGSLSWPVPRIILRDIQLRRALLAPPYRVTADDGPRHG